VEINFDALEKYIYKNIPISLSLGVKIDDATSEKMDKAKCNYTLEL
jgi:hypothetical protein